MLTTVWDNGHDRKVGTRFEGLATGTCLETRSGRGELSRRAPDTCMSLPSGLRRWNVLCFKQMFRFLFLPSYPLDVGKGTCAVYSAHALRDVRGRGSQLRWGPRFLVFSSTLWSGIQELFVSRFDCRC